jgi:tetratricopeptide (TPR) repeat protein
VTTTYSPVRNDTGTHILGTAQGLGTIAYRHAIELAEDANGRRLLRTRLARAAMSAGDMDTAVGALEVFDGYLCPAEFLLYGPTPYREVIELAHGLRDTARRSGVLRAVAFAAALAGEAALLAGDLSTAQHELEEAVDLHHDIGAAAGEAHALQRLAEVHLAKGETTETTRLLQQALPLARWSAISLHLLQRIFGTMIRAAAGRDSARAVVDRAESTLGTEDLCPFCNIMLAVPAVIACADVGDLDRARYHLQVAEKSLDLWEGTSWQAAVLEARAHLADAEDDTALAGDLRGQAAVLFHRAGQPLDAARCRVPSSV